MPLTLVTGPANAEKAGVVLDRLRAALDREPILVVPTVPDVERYRRELAEDGVVFGARVETFDRLLAEIARRAGVGGVPLGPLARERVVAAAARDARLVALAGSAATPGFARAACRLFDELEEDRIEPGRFAGALRAWAAADERGDLGRSQRSTSPHRPYGEELARLYRAYRSLLDRLGRRDETLHHAAALDAIREAPARWGATPVLFYGFDDLSPLQRDAVAALAATEAPITASLTYERGRHAFAARGETFEALRPVAAEVIALQPNADHYAPQARAALHALERGLFEASRATAPPASPAPVTAAAPTLFDDLVAREADPVGEIVARRRGDVVPLGSDGATLAGDAVVFLEGGGERAELELVAAEVARLIRDEGVAPEEIAVVLRRPDEAEALVGQVFGAYRIAIAATRRTDLGHTPLGRGLVALLRAATGGTAADLLAWLRTPGRIRESHRVDRLEADVRRSGARTASEARALWDEHHADVPLGALDRVADAAARGPAALLERLDAELSALFAAPHRRRAPVLGAAEAAEADVLAAGRRALADLADAAALDPALVPEPPELAALLAAVDVRLGDRSAPGAVQVTDPQSLRARRVRALFCCRLQEKTFPAAPRPEPFLGDDERRSLNAASGLRLRAHEDVLGAERYLLYAAVSRPERRLYLSWHAADDDGDPAVRSSFVDDVALLFSDDPLGRRRRRDLGAVGWPGEGAPCDRERVRAEAHALPPAREAVAAPLAHPAVLGELRARESWSASALETWASCPVKWFVERHLDPEPLVPDAEPMVRGTLAHKVLEEALRRLVDGGGLTPARLPEARAAVRCALDDLADRFPMSVDASRRVAMRRRLEADLLRYVEAAALSRTRFVPHHLEERFAELDAGDGIVLRGRVDRIDVRPGTNEALLYDYKGKTAFPAAKWLDEGRFQLAVYALAARRLLDLDPVGALYQPLGAQDLRPRGALRDGADPDLPAVRDDRLEPDAFEQLLGEAVAAAVRAARDARDGALEPCPDRCAYGGGCAYPTICRSEA
jgi:ATP-dependent helicase/DNAse subunit B